MIESTLHQVSRARSKTADLLALFLALSVIHGLYFPQELMIFGFALSSYVLLSHLNHKFVFIAEKNSAFGLTDFLLLGMILFSVLGVIHPVRVKDGLLEALRWGIFWFIYRLGVQISSDELAKKLLAQRVEWVAIVVAILGWVPWVSKVAGRLSSVFGYPNATAAFLGAVLLVYSRRKPAQIFLGISLLGTGSRAGVGLFLAVLTGQQLLLWIRTSHKPFSLALNQRFHVKKKLLGVYLGRLWVISLGIAGMVFIVFFNRTAWENLMSWGLTSTSWQERLVYYKDGLSLAWNAKGLPQAGGWLAFPTIQRFPYWTADPHSSLINVLLNQGAPGIICAVIWGVFTLIQILKTWGNRVLWKSEVELKEIKAQARAWSALAFLVLHSLVDADFSFSSLGFLFWMIFGSIRKRVKHPRYLFMTNTLVSDIWNRGMLLLSLIMCLFCGSVLLNPTLLERERSWNTKAVELGEKDPGRSIELWNTSLSWDQTQIRPRREQAEFLLRWGKTEIGLKAVEEVLSWQPLDLAAYEWAQSVVWEAAEVQRRTHPETANSLYHWVEDVPRRIEGRVVILSSTDRLLWQGYRDFKPSQHIRLLAEYARQRQLTQPLAKT
ncbi:O-antigen ligase family protein [Desulfosporosinus sp. Sb-LF]|uniref:O-antigen ligase family protein n=1 Tax=Desulfosporosinus sp. Sb-LF TaxID=2560027 RepID=UPI00107F01F7|nr:O-antigen ligase family protein [Desulfosporosinus sp. Sb-LF]TGE33927.1 O-antigen ligase domain-containing protein [Desulfosporosinus sp. Sb-LF]